MHEAFEAYIEHGKGLAEVRKLNWNFDIDSSGVSKTGWNLTELGGGRTPTLYLRNLGQDAKTLALLNQRRIARGLPAQPRRALSPGWRDLLKAVSCDQLLFRRNTPSAANQNIRPLRVLATCAGDLEPWQLNVDVIREAVGVASESQQSGKLADLILGVVKNVIDGNHLAEACPLYPSTGIKREHAPNNRKSRATKSKEQLLDDLEQRKRADRLPERRAFWELIRILFTEEPRTFADAVRFAALKVLALCGLRIGEAVTLPLDWKRIRYFFDPRTGRPAGEPGGYSSAVMLRLFGEKQWSAEHNSNALFETAQYVPELFVEILTETLDGVARLTQPLRDTLRLQVETGRLLPWYAKEDLVPATELYTRITGNPFWLDMPKDLADGFIARYKHGFNPDVLNELNRYQVQQYQSSKRLDYAMYVYFNRIVNAASGAAGLLTLRDSAGREYTASRKNWSGVYFRIGEVEDYLATALKTKVSDLSSTSLGTNLIIPSLGTKNPGIGATNTGPNSNTRAGLSANGPSHDTKDASQNTNLLMPWEYLFLTPKRSLAEERNGGITDITRYFSVGIPDPTIISVALGEEKDNRESIFMRYGKTDEDRKLTLRSHAPRHLMNTVLFQQGLADTIITKQFGRRSVAQSYEYDHRSSQEVMRAIDLVDGFEHILGEKASLAYREIRSGRATGPVVDTFERIKREQGEEEALEYLRVAADGFHPTPYGHCINSFTVDPCPKNLECFAGCRHLTATNLPENRRHLEKLKRQFGVALAEVQARPAGTVGRENQITHATVRLEAVAKLLATPAGERVFPDGPDFSKQEGLQTALDVE